MVGFVLLPHNLNQKLLVVSSGIKNKTKPKQNNNALLQTVLEEQAGFDGNEGTGSKAWSLLISLLLLFPVKVSSHLDLPSKLLWECVSLSPSRICLAQGVPCREAKPRLALSFDSGRDLTGSQDP